MAKLQLAVVQSTDPTLRTTGEIYDVPIGENESPVISDVSVRPGQSSRFVLAPGRYAYLFHVATGSGKFKLEVRNAVGNTPYALGEFDTQISHYGRVLQFEVT
jgi:hypothetical protein